MTSTSRWIAQASAVLAVATTLVALGQSLGYFDPHNEVERSLLAQQKDESNRLAEHYLQHLGDTWQVGGTKGARQIFFSAIDDCIRDVDPRWSRVIPGYVASRPPLVAGDYLDMTAVVYASQNKPRACPVHQRDRPSRREPTRDDGRWIQEVWRYADRCWAYAWFDRGNPYAGWQLDHQGCRH